MSLSDKPCLHVQVKIDMGLAACEVFGFLYACVALHMFCSAQSNFRSGLSVVLVLALSVFLSVSLYLFTYVSLDLFMLL